MKKVKWLKLNIRLEFETAVRRLSLDSFTEEKGKGFIFDKIRHDFASGRFIERIVYHDKISSFDGSETTVERIEYRTTNFSVALDSLPVMQITNPPRTLKPFSQALVKNLGLGVSLEEIDINPINWLNEISSSVNINLTQLDISRVRVSDYATAKMQIIGSSDLRKYYKEELEGKKIRIDRLVCSVNTLEYSGKLKITNSGLAYIDVRNENEFTKIVFDTLKKVTIQS
ncbi:hypothetical protein DP190_01060 [Enterobacter cloacae]|uniref:hypothetical protein n=1 Tax=Enterobacteriaceae TaxID=543 RepID=UPI000DCE41D1|nr:MULTISPECIES: hypothetical protein [Enterobacter]EFE8339248.1 hypothetical protein [Escherichia coli]EHN8761081.1 hypothetical protein [Enterobacter asburiae]RAY88701.1 hypothetical protein DP190_01060 [Enterobacter cloacae]HCM9479638.1 hypothetical protein [Enterobacter roggenkampii]HEG1872865.1 hypothetical protein [Citrobacter freundii]